jgi:asparagine synthase (glutamine-hydrolysing)
MCGLAGIFNPDAAREVDGGLLRRMTRALAHRGPDGDGFHIEPGIGLGHRQLAIIDPRAGQQPMHNEDGSVVLVFNGMIYNFQDLVPELRALGHTFRTRCDTETIIHAWEEWGPDCLARLDGMFALALWDRGRRTLFLARDRMGKKPLYHATLPGGRFVFASEMAALRQIDALPRKLSASAIEDYLAYGYIPDPATIHAGVFRLQAAHCLLLRRGEGIAAPRRYWRPAVTQRAIGETEAVVELSERLRAATAAPGVGRAPGRLSVRRRLRRRGCLRRRLARLAARHLHDRLRGSRRRDPVRRGRRAPLRHPPAQRARQADRHH